MNWNYNKKTNRNGEGEINQFPLFLSNTFLMKLFIGILAILSISAISVYSQFEAWEIPVLTRNKTDSTTMYNLALSAFNDKDYPLESMQQEWDENDGIENN